MTKKIIDNTQLQMNVEKVDKYYKISFTFRNVVLNTNFLEELCDLIRGTLNANEINKKSKRNTVYLLDYDYKKRKDILKEAEHIFVKQLVSDKGVYFEYQEILEEFLTKHNDPKMYDKQYIKKAANNYEQLLETYTLTEINNLCEKSLKDEILKDIEDSYYE